MTLIDQKVHDFYTLSNEDTRLQTGLGPLEFLRNKQLISAYLPEQPGVIADVGGGTGHYAAWLAALGHTVHLVDPVDKHIQQAKKRAKKSKKAFLCHMGEARILPIANHTADVVILHGPLYHLKHQSERIAALNEAQRVLKPGGTVIGFAITYTASTMAALQNGMIYQPEIYTMCTAELQTGRHEPPAAFPGMLAQAHFHKPAELQEEFRIAGLRCLSLQAVEGIAWMDAHFFTSWATADKRERMLGLIQMTESDPGLLCLSPHIMIAARKDDTYQ